jgi:hypothetical protein
MTPDVTELFLVVALIAGAMHQSGKVLLDG